MTCSPKTCACSTYASANLCECSGICNTTSPSSLYNDVCTNKAIDMSCSTTLRYLKDKVNENNNNDNDAILQPNQQEIKKNSRSLFTSGLLSNYIVPWGVKAVYNDLLNSISPSGKGEGIKVAIVDSGIDMTHPDLGHKVASNDYYNWTDDGSFEDLNGHGTHVAGIVGADGYYIGVAHLAAFQIHKVLTKSGTGSFSWVDQALNIACNDPTVHIVTMSIGAIVNYNSNYSTEANLKKCVELGKIIFVAASNEDTLYDFIGYPASSP